MPGVAHLMVMHFRQVIRRVERQRLDVEFADRAVADQVIKRFDAQPFQGRNLAVSEFNQKNRAKGTWQSYCRSCSRQYLRDHYRENKSYYIDKAHTRNRSERTDIRRRLLEFLWAHPCVDCGEQDPIVLQFDHTDPILRRPAITGVYVYRQTAIKQLTNKLIFGDNPSGEIFHVDADNLPRGGQDSIRRILFNDKGTSKTLLQLIQEKNTSQGKSPAARADLRLGLGPQGQVFVLNKRDGTIRQIVP